MQPQLEERLGIVIVTRNRVKTLLGTLARLTALEAPYPIVVVDNASTDGTAEMVLGHYPKVDIITLPENLGASARNYGVQQLEREFIAFADDDSWWARDSLAQAVSLFDQHPKLGMIMSRVLVRDEQTLDPCCELMSRSPLPKSEDLPGLPILGFMGCAVVFRRQPFLEIGGFRESFRSGGEEAIVAMDLAARGWKLAYVDSLVTHHYPAVRDNMEERYAEGVCVDIWLACLRRRPRHIAQTMAAQLRGAMTHPEYRKGIRKAYPRIPAVLRERKPVPNWLEEQLEALDRQRANEGSS